MEEATSPFMVQSRGVCEDADCPQRRRHLERREGDGLLLSPPAGDSLDGAARPDSESACLRACRLSP
jgi:hypothetical protein